MTEIPEHLRKRAEEARKKAEAKAAAESGGDAAPCLLYTSPSPRDLNPNRV